jgi:hypothetical protein
MLTTMLHAAMVRHAGPDLMWTGGDILGTRPRSDARRGLRVWLFDYSGGLCVFCGVAPAEELAHIVATGPQENNGSRIRRGWVPGNIAPSCHTCNEYDSHNNWPVVPMSRIARPDLICTVWPSETERRTLGASTIHA